MEQLKQMSVTELKALVYDHLSQIEQSQAIIKAVNQVLGEKKEEAPVKAEKVK